MQPFRLLLTVGEGESSSPFEPWRVRNGKEN